MRGLIADCRHAARLFLRTPAASSIAVLVLAVSMAVVCSFLSLYVDLVLRPEPGFQQGGRLATVGQNGGPQLFGMPYKITERMVNEMISIEAVAATFNVNVLVGPERESRTMTMVSEQFFPGLKPRLALGRGFLPEEHAPGAEPRIVISYALWQQRYQGDPGVIGTTLEITRNPQVFYQPGPATSGEQRTTPIRETTSFLIVGVMSRALPGLAGTDIDSWIPLEIGIPLYVGAFEQLPNSMVPPNYVRKQFGVSAAAVASELRSRYTDDVVSAKDYYPGVRYDAVDGIVSNMTVKRDAERQLHYFLVGSLLLALVAAVNAGLFLLARAPDRRREIGVRLSVGATVGRISRQLATEAITLVGLSTALSFIFSYWLTTYLKGLPFLRDARWTVDSFPDWRTLSLFVSFVLLLAVFVSLLPVLEVRRMSVGAASRQLSAAPSRLHQFASTLQIAAAGPIVGAAIAMTWYLGAMLFGDPGYETRNRYFVQFDGGRMQSGMSLDEYVVEVARRHEAFATIPGVTTVGFGYPVPAANLDNPNPIRIGRSNDPSDLVVASGGMFDDSFVEAVGLRLMHGRAPTADEFSSGASVALVNQTLANEVWGRENVVGEYLPLQPGAVWSGSEVIGVVEDLAVPHPSATVVPWVFQVRDPSIGRTAVIVTTMGMADLREALERKILDGRLNVEIGEIRSLKALRANVLVADLSRATLTIASAALIVLLAAYGNFCTQRFLVLASRREFAIRMALGAGPNALRTRILLRAFLRAFPGLLLGGLWAFIAVTWLRADHFGGSPSPSVVGFAVVVGLSLIVLAATLGPSTTVWRSQPNQLLRSE